MQTSKDIILYTVGQLVKELTKYSNNHSEDEIVCYLPDGDSCYFSSLNLDDDGDLCIYLDEQYEDGAHYDVDMLLSELEGYESQTKVYLAGCGLYMTFEPIVNNKLFQFDEEEEWIGCEGTSFGEYEEDEDVIANEKEGRRQSGWSWLTPAEKRELEKQKKKEQLESILQTTVLGILTLLTIYGLFYNVRAIINHSGTLWENIIGSIVCLILAIIGSLTLYFDNKK